jgi:hypothetical protein
MSYESVDDREIALLHTQDWLAQSRLQKNFRQKPSKYNSGHTAMMLILTSISTDPIVRGDRRISGWEE